MLENAGSLSITRRNFKHQLATLVNHHVHFLLFRIVEADIAFAQDETDRRNLALFRPTNAVFALEESIEETSLDLYLLFIVKGEVMAAGDKTEILELGSSMDVAFNVASQMEKYTTPVANRQQGNFDITHVVFLGRVVSIVAESIDLVVDGLVLSVGFKLIVGQITLDSVWAPIPCASAWSSILIRNDLSIPPKLDKCV
ncbi:hypothetical protein HG531_003713 [Fusarium graminearum]|nr:hypothetical protein HG531_003713 [Fusarium graminearum]